MNKVKEYLYLILLFLVLLVLIWLEYGLEIAIAGAAAIAMFGVYTKFIISSFSLLKSSSRDWKSWNVWALFSGLGTAGILVFGQLGYLYIPISISFVLGGAFGARQFFASRKLE